MIELLIFRTGGVEIGRSSFVPGASEAKSFAPVWSALLRTPEGNILFDTGLHPDCQSDPAGRFGERLAGLFRIGFQPGEEVSARLEAIDRDPARLTSSSTRIFISIMSAATR